VNHTRFPK